MCMYLLFVPQQLPHNHAKINKCVFRIHCSRPLVSHSFQSWHNNKIFHHCWWRQFSFLFQWVKFQNNYTTKFTNNKLAPHNSLYRSAWPGLYMLASWNQHMKILSNKFLFTGSVSFYHQDCTCKNIYHLSYLNPPLLFWSISDKANFGDFTP